MRNKFYFSIFLFFSLSVWAALEDLKQKSKTVIVEVELESVPGISFYEMEVRPPGEKKSLNYEQRENLFSLKLDVGHYSMRTRMKTKTEIGPWSEWVALVAPPDTVVLNPADYRHFVNRKEKFIPVNFSWNFATGAEKYRIWFEKINPNDLAPEKRNKIKKIEITENSYSAKLPEGQYKIGIQSISRNSIASEVVYYKELFSVDQSILPKIMIKKTEEEIYGWEKVQGANVRVELFRKSFFASDYEKVSSEVVDFDNWKVPPGLRPGEYKVEFQFVSEILKSGGVEIIKFVKRPTEQDFSDAIKKQE